ncbi:hypothetical protein GNI_052720 [Gregarina niphandrodes]|uniref:Uncharacterized protein n=1 Tax=Gregarina niphandrodes TaxID=110365 RepID=A0A023B953_GRENI|nr:hypothetical protein GNI_052720 [Gregarina niphandrodes]EZG71443.1 hypothetical protein GNI_052720 [Gregarina niphandrodes]|eukprot:XP_011129828.1 hypothetical protein GNI_052720 [Gregarina niphandrodes]
MDACESAHRKVKAGSTRAGMREATKKGWQQLDWSDCSDYGGKLVCTGGYNTDDGNLQCHYFATPWVYDLPTVWELIVRYLKPTQCSYQCNDEDEHEKLLTVRRGVEIASSIPGVDLDSASAQELYTLGKAVPLHLEYKDTGNMRVACDSYSPHLVTCDESTCWSNVQTPSGNVMNWGYVTGFHDGPPLPLCYSGAIREGYEINDWLCECYEVDSGWEENVQQAWNEIVHARQMSDH